MNGFNHTDAESILKTLSLVEKTSLLAGEKYWRTVSIPEKGVRPIKISDGPNGVRGESIHASTKATCFPAGSCVASTFNPALVYRLGQVVGRECKQKDVGVILGPTVNLHRSPLGGRNFEAFSEDPTLSAIMGTQWVRGVQSEGVAACPKHFVGNECETHRKKSNTIVGEITLRELYAYPFQWILKHANPWMIMASYNKVNGVSMSENHLLQALLRDEWGFEGLVMSDFEGVYKLEPAVLAGTDLEMPGPPAIRDEKLFQAVKTGIIPTSKVDELALRVLRLAEKVPMRNEHATEQASNDSEAGRLGRQIASEGIVLLKNTGILPIKSKRIAVFGSPAETPIIHGGGSPTINSTYVVSPLMALREKYEVVYHPGVPIFKKIPSPSPDITRTVSSGQPGIDCYWFNGSTLGQDLVMHEVLETTRTLVIDQRIRQLKPEHCSSMEFILRPKTTGQHCFGVTACGKTTLSVDGKQLLVHDGFTDVQVEYIMQPGDFEVKSSLSMEAGRDYHVVVDSLSTTAPSPSAVFAMAPQATQVGFYENLEDIDLEAVEAIAGSVDASLVFVANNKEYESESFDRVSLLVSDLQNRLVDTVSKCSKTVVISQTGGGIEMPWLDRVDGVIQCWFAGQEVGNALVDVVSGVVSPSGKLPVTFVRQVQDSPTHGNFPTDENLEVKYAEGLRMGYRGISDPLFPFGFGLSYTTFSIRDLVIENRTESLSNCEGVKVDVSVEVKNTGTTAGSEVVQVYIDGVLKGFQKAHLAPQEKAKSTITLDKYAFSSWDPTLQSWTIEGRTYNCSVRQHSQKVLLEGSITLTDATWTGL